MNSSRSGSTTSPCATSYFVITPSNGARRIACEASRWGLLPSVGDSSRKSASERPNRWSCSSTRRHRGLVAGDGGFGRLQLGFAQVQRLLGDRLELDQGPAALDDPPLHVEVRLGLSQHRPARRDSRRPARRAGCCRRSPAAGPWSRARQGCTQTCSMRPRASGRMCATRASSARHGAGHVDRGRKCAARRHRRWPAPRSSGLGRQLHDAGGQLVGVVRRPPAAAAAAAQQQPRGRPRQHGRQTTDGNEQRAQRDAGGAVEFVSVMAFMRCQSSLRLHVGTSDGGGEFEQAHPLVEQGAVVGALGVAKGALRVQEVDQVGNAQPIGLQDDVAGLLRVRQVLRVRCSRPARGWSRRR